MMLESYFTTMISILHGTLALTSYQKVFKYLMGSIDLNLQIVRTFHRYGYFCKQNDKCK